MKYVHLLLAAGAALMPLAAVPAAAAEVQIAATGPVVELSVTESVSAAPDIATLSAGVTTEAPTAVEAMSLNAERMAAVIARIRSEGIDEEDIRTTGIRLNPVYDYDNGRQNFRGYSVANRVSVTLRDIDRTGAVLDRLVESGATDLGGIEWSIDDPAEAMAQARAAAFAGASERALEYARMAGYASVRLLEIAENINAGRPMPLVQQAEAAVSTARAPTPVVPGRVETSVTVGAKFEMTR